MLLCAAFQKDILSCPESVMTGESSTVPGTPVVSGFPPALTVVNPDGTSEACRPCISCKVRTSSLLWPSQNAVCILALCLSFHHRSSTLKSAKHNFDLMTEICSMDFFMHTSIQNLRSWPCTEKVLCSAGGAGGEFSIENERWQGWSTMCTCSSWPL